MQSLILLLRMEPFNEGPGNVLVTMECETVLSLEESPGLMFITLRSLVLKSIQEARKESLYGKRLPPWSPAVQLCSKCMVNGSNAMAFEYEKQHVTWIQQTKGLRLIFKYFQSKYVTGRDVGMRTCPLLPTHYLHCWKKEDSCFPERSHGQGICLSKCSQDQWTEKPWMWGEEGG